jgi:hypothetical protein
MKYKHTDISVSTGGELHRIKFDPFSYPDSKASLGENKSINIQYNPSRADSLRHGE